VQVLIQGFSYHLLSFMLRIMHISYTFKRCIICCMSYGL
jgi:hypothetical protein